MKKKVLLGMSGGVDSSVAAILLLEQGYDVTGVTLKLRPDKYMEENASGGCCSIDDINDARRVAYKLGIQHLVLNFTDIFSKNVIDYFVGEYKQGRTPNPCIACNKYVKFNAMLQKALLLGFDYIATGHYSNIRYDNHIHRWLLEKSDSSKDQSYVLYHLTQKQLSHTLMPLSNIEKSRTRELASLYNLPVAQKPDSQEICFVKDNDYAGFIETYTGEKFECGNFIDSTGKILGKHKGITRYTIGQRKNLGISTGYPIYVTDINPQNNTITLGAEGSQYKSELIADNLNFIPFNCLDKELNVDAKIRYNSIPAKAKLIPISSSQIKVSFYEPQRAITKGQAVVFYDKNIVIGGGTIVS